MQKSLFTNYDVWFNGTLGKTVLAIQDMRKRCELCTERGGGHVEGVGEQTTLKCHEVGKVSRFL